MGEGNKTNNSKDNNNDMDRHGGPSGEERGRGRERDRRPPPSNELAMARKPPLPSAVRGHGRSSGNGSRNGSDSGNGSRNGSDSGNGSVNRHSREDSRTRSRSVSQSRAPAPGQGRRQGPGQGQGQGPRERSTSRNRQDARISGNGASKANPHSRNSAGARARERKNDSDTSDDEYASRRASANTHQPAGEDSGHSNITTTDAARIAQAWRDYASLLSASSVVSGAGAGIGTIKEELSPSLLSPASLHHRPFSGVIPVNAQGTGTLPTITTETIDALARQLGGKEGTAREEETSILRRAFFTAVNEMRQVVSQAVMCETCEEDTPVKSPVKALRSSQSKLPVKQLAATSDANNETLYASDFECEDTKDLNLGQDQESDCELVDDEVVDEVARRGKGMARSRNGNVFELTTELQEGECDEIVEEDEPSSTKSGGTSKKNSSSIGTGTRSSSSSGPYEDEVVEDDEENAATTGPGQSNLKRSSIPVKSPVVKSVSAQSNLPVKSMKQPSHPRNSTDLHDEEKEDHHQQQQQQHQQQQQQQQARQPQAKGPERSVPEDDDDDDEIEEDESYSNTAATSAVNSRSGSVSVSRIPSMLSAASALDTERRPLR